MDEGYGSNYITIEDEDGNEFELEQIATLAYKDSDYSLFLPADMTRTTATSYSASRRRTTRRSTARWMTKTSWSPCTTCSWSSFSMRTKIQTRPGTSKFHRLPHLF